MAAEQGYDSIGWTTADIQSKRWSDEYAEGYRIEYDQDIPKFLNKYGKKWGATVNSTMLENGSEVWSMDITDSMKDSVLHEGQVMYSDRIKPNIDKYGFRQDNISRANKPGELVNDYYYALTNVEWRTFYDEITRKGFLATANVGVIAPIVVNDKLIISERMYTGKDAHDYVVIDAFKLVNYKDTTNYVLKELEKIIDEGTIEYDSRTIYQKLIRFIASYGGTEILSRFNRDDLRYDVAHTERAKADDTQKIYGDSQERSSREGISLGDKPSIQGDNELLNNSEKDYIETNSKAIMTTERIDYLIEDSGAGSRVDYANYWITSISPTEFLNMTLEKGWQDRSKFDKYPSEWNEESTVETYDYIGELKRNMRQTPYLAIDITTGKVDGHEGRHRMRALEKQGITSVEIRIEFRDEDGRIIKYSPDGKRLQIKDALKIKNQYNTNQSTTITNIIPLNKDYRDEILANYGENAHADASIKYSDRDNVSIYDLMGENDKLIKENEQLKEDVDRLKERLKIERQVTHGNYFNENQLGAVAAHIRNIARSNYNKKDLVTLLNGIYQYIAHSPDLNWQDLFAQCYDVAGMVLNEARDVTVTDDYFKTILDDIRSTKISVNEKQIANAKAHLGNRWRSHFFKKIDIVENGTSLDRQWQTWSDEKEGYPNIFDAEISDADMLVELYDIYNDVREGSERIVEYDMEEQTRWLAREIYNQYWNVSPIRTTADKYDERLKRQHIADKKKAQELIKKARERKDIEEIQSDWHNECNLSFVMSIRFERGILFIKSPPWEYYGIKAAKEQGKINGLPLYIINSIGIAYHQNEVLYIIIAKAFLYTLKRDDIQS